MLRSSSRNSLTFLDYFTIQNKNTETYQTILKDNQNNKLILMKEIQCLSQQQSQETAATLSLQKQLKHEQLLSLLDYYPQPSLNKIAVFYQYCQFSLADEFQNRVDQRRLFQQSQLWSILTSLIFGLQYLQANNIGHGSISLSDAYLNDSGFVKICDPTLASTNPFIFTQGYLYSPELMYVFKTDQQLDINIFKSDVFCLGCCIIQLTLMRNIIPQIINTQRSQICEQSLSRILEQLQYSDLSPQFIQFIYQMVQINCEYRPDFCDLKRKIYNLLDIIEEQQEQHNTQRYSKVSDVVEKVRKIDSRSLLNSLQRSLSQQQYLNSSMSFKKIESHQNNQHQMLSSLKKLQEIYIHSEEQFSKTPIYNRTQIIHNKNVCRTLQTQSIQSTGNIDLKNVKFITQQDDNCHYLLNKSHQKTEATALLDKNTNLDSFIMIQQEQVSSFTKIKHKKTFSNLVNKQGNPLSNMENKPIYRLSEPNLENYASSNYKQYLIAPKRQSSIKPRKTMNITTYTDPNFLQMMQKQVSNIMKKRQIQYI